MSQRNHLSRTPLSIICQVSLLLQGLALIPSLSVIGGDTDANAQTPSDAADPFGQAEMAPPPVEAVPSEPEVSTSAALLQPLEGSDAPVSGFVEEIQADPWFAEDASPDPLDSAGVTPWYPESDSADQTLMAQPDPIGGYRREAIAPPEDYPTPQTANAEPTLQNIHQSNLYVDPTDYSLPTANNSAAAEASAVATPAPEESDSFSAIAPPPPEVVEQSAWGEQPIQEVSQESEQHRYAEDRLPVPASIQQAQQANLYSPALQPLEPPAIAAPVGDAAAPAEPVYYAEPEPSYAALPQVPFRTAPVYPQESAKADIDGIHYRTKTAARNFDWNRLRRSSRPGNGNSSMIFPLAIPSEITSLFGWRIHPIFGGSRFHSGIDLGAPTGTPVVAAYSGTVSIADWMGGYGQTVVLQHQNSTLETLYAHLSSIFVQPGEVVEQGQVIGEVGSTGNSTGPHLHFELRELTPEGWMAMDPGTQMEYALAQLIGSLETAPQIATPTSDNPALTTLPSLEMPAPPPPLALLNSPVNLETASTTLLDVPTAPPLPLPPVPVTLEVTIPATE
ncbi:peptidoglycan DD-metalloendopeptidase family protein [Laspinema sp. D1]|uniref:peptidoglycan DD-metalloendopeptidase family protein n=1 Tax=Laspinema palackyanum TaxID=3231601 RepID=UPI00348801A3|nr:peptidoglycan DD-metalloendopeptidase family protein [Laspinema sp. D2b]